MIGTAVSWLDDMPKLIPAVKDLGVRHITYDVIDEDYATLGQALVYTLKTGLGEDFTDDVKQAWETVYSFLVKTMKEGAYSTAAA